MVPETAVILAHVVLYEDGLATIRMYMSTFGSAVLERLVMVPVLPEKLI